MSHESAVRLEQDQLVLGPVRVTFQRTLRIPENGLHDLPPGLGPSRSAESRTTPTRRRLTGWPAVA